MHSDNDDADDGMQAHTAHREGEAQAGIPRVEHTTQEKNGNNNNEAKYERVHKLSEYVTHTEMPYTTAVDGRLGNPTHGMNAMPR